MTTSTVESRRQKQARAKARRDKIRRAEAKFTEAIEAIYDKPIEDWDSEELARGRPRDMNGDFRGRKPEWISAAVHEEAMKRFKDEANSELRALVPQALAMVQKLITSDEVDEKGKPLVPAGVKLDAAKWVVEHLVGKPTQRIEADVSVRLQGILASVLVQPGQEAPLGLQEAVDVDSWEEPTEEI